MLRYRPRFLQVEFMTFLTSVKSVSVEQMIDILKETLGE